MEQENRRKRRKAIPAQPKKEPVADELQAAPKEKPRGKLRWRWLLNTLAATFVVVALAVTAFSLAMYSYYSSTILATLEGKAQTAAGMFRNYTDTTYLFTARQFVNQFEEKSTIELQILNAGGRVLMSSTMDISGASVDSSDVRTAISEKRVATSMGPDGNTGDHVVSASAPVVYNGTVVGVVRMVTSLRKVETQMTRIIAATSSVGAVILIVMGVSASFFIRSVLDPVIRVTETAKRIATGSYGVQMEKRSNDEMGELVDAINDMSMKIDQAERTQSEFISSVSHELRTPLTAISGWAETLYNGEVRDAADVKKGMGIIVSEAQRLTRMVEELLEFSRMETGRFNLSVEPIDIQAELEDAVYTYREFFRRKGLELDYTECGGELPIIDGDPERLRQVFCNLLDNADKHGGTGGRVDVSVVQEDASVVIRIRDYGPGVPEDELPFIKYKFYKGSSKARGSGIGLAVCEEIINSHSGSLDIGNAPGGGCVVTIRLPLGVENV